MNRCGNENGVSGTVGAVLLVGIFAAAVALAGVAVFSQPLPEKIPSLSAEITVHGDTILISHLGGDSFPKESLSILMDGSEIKDSLTELNGGAWSSWVIGDTLVYHVPSGQDIPDSIQIIYRGGRSGSVLYNWGTSQGSETPTPTVTVTTTATPTPTTTTTPVTTTTTPVPPLPVVANFSGTPTGGYSPLAVQFTDSSTGPVTNRSWSFGDGNTSTEPNPQYTYPTAGSWPVSLTVSNGTGTHTLTRSDYITVSTPVSGTVTLSASKGAYIESGGEMQFRVTGTASTITVGGTGYSLNQGDTVRLVVESNQHGLIYASSSMITTFSFNDVSLYRNGVFVGRGAVSAIQINGYDQYQSTLNLFMPPASASDTYFNVNGVTLINYQQSSTAIRITGLRGNMNLNPCTASQVYYNGGAAGYQILGPQVNSITPSSGQAGATVTITNLSGMYFETGSSPVVRLQKGSSTITATSVNVISSSQIQCTFSLAGAETGQWNVVVVNQEGVAGVGTNLFTVLPGPLTASFTYTLPSPNVVSLADTSTGGATTWDWNFGDGTPHSYVQNPPAHTYASGGSYVVTLTVTDGIQSSSTQQTIPVFIPATHTATLNAGKAAYVELGGVVQFTVTGPYSGITVNGVSYSLNPGDTVKLVMGSNGYGSISSSSSMITTFEFDDVSLTINGEFRNRGPVSNIYINGYENYQSTLNLYMPSASTSTYFVFDGTPLINWATSSAAVRITGLSGAMNLASTSTNVYYVGGATGYTIY